MRLKTRLFGRTFQFKDVKDVLAKANEEKSGDILAGIAAESAEERIAAKVVLSELTLEDLRNNPVVPYEIDEVTRIIDDNLNKPIYNSIKNWTVAELREYILNDEVTGEDIKRISRGLTSEMVAAVAKLMTNMDLIYAASKINITAKANTTIGLPGTLAVRLQPNHPTDDPEGILASIREGLSYGNGDAVIGINPVEDSVAGTTRILEAVYNFVEEWEIPTQICVLSHVTTQMEAFQKGAPGHLIFQSLAGTQKANEAFGINIAMLKEAQEIALKYGRATGPNVMYFETGQGSELSSYGHHGADQVTLEARCYGLAKQFSPFLVNTVVGFIGPEYLYDSKQVIRAGLEDHFMGKLTGVPMGVDACYTNHMKADQNDIENLAVLLSAAGVNYFMGIPMGDDVMLNYQCTSYHDIATLRQLLKKSPIPEFAKWLEKMGLWENGRLTAKAGDASIFARKGVR
ncbi:ethanolamine ammonia-lyase subunit EutB [Carboxydothermus ferrireducens]|uniref:Ethanolamine ammonia-lyase large subunit n=1 Tax=Carboxydothermus ferrireducens DSM 11255 TaxID=1119529 RepID=A0ABX2RFA2_9THEO|nr:ethanolamine ammonia-lyase subunit EutB [Carboxydothermus ferrireducens]NYE58493.1 ethanolamine ammonia-lyase large subunit [Carboxydothermus ferrireducens DSM 11255]